MNYIADDREIFLPSFDLNGKRLSDSEYMKLRDDLLNSDAENKEEISNFIQDWLRAKIHASQ